MRAGRIGGAVLAVIVASGAAAEPGRPAKVHTSEGYGVSVAVPAPYTVREHGPDDLTIGRLEPSGWFRAVAEVRLSVAGEGADYPSFESFALADLRAFCAADGTGESLYCEEPEARQPFATESGLAGEALYLRRVHETFATGGRVVDGLGPIFLFDVSALVPGDGWAALSVRPPVDPGTDADGALLRAVAGSLTGPAP